MDPAPPYSTAYSRYVLGLLLLVTAFNVVDRSIVALVAQDIRTEMDLTDRQMGLLMGFAFTIVHLLAGLPIARFADRGGVRRTIIAISLFAWSAMTVATGMARTFPQLLLARMGVGIGEAGGGPPAHSLIADYAPRSLASGLSVLPMGAVAGLGLGFLVGGWIQHEWGWRAALYAMGVPGLLLAIVVRLTVREPPRTLPVQTESMWDAARALLALPSYRWTLVAMCIAGLSVFGRSSWEVSFLRRTYEMDARTAASWYFLISPLPSFFGAYVCARVTDRLAARDPRWFAWACALGNAAFVPTSMAFYLWPRDQTLGIMPVAFAWSAVASLLGAAAAPATSAIAQRLAPPSRRAFSAALWSMVFNFVGLGLGAYLVGDWSTRLEATYGTDALRYALATISVTPLFAAALNLLAARSIRNDIRTVDAS
ncbi:MAG: MFS transporter [Candidatus Binatia bacterium]|nr:MFS transporter [Candidatus Binatia bacterium]